MSQNICPRRQNYQPQTRVTRLTPVNEPSRPSVGLMRADGIITAEFSPSDHHLSQYSSSDHQVYLHVVQ